MSKSTHATAAAKPCINIIGCEWMSEINITKPMRTARAKIISKISANLLLRSCPRPKISKTNPDEANMPYPIAKENGTSFLRKFIKMQV